MKQGEREDILALLGDCIRIVHHISGVYNSLLQRLTHLEQQVRGMLIEEETPEKEKEGTD